MIKPISSGSPTVYAYKKSMYFSSAVSHASL